MTWSRRCDADEYERQEGERITKEANIKTKKGERACLAGRIRRKSE
jgi:hypothetical protein